MSPSEKNPQERIVGLLFRRRTLFLSLLLLVAVLFNGASASLLINAASAQPLKKAFPFQKIESFLGITAIYDIGFLWFDKAAVATFRLEREGKGYKAILEAETKGFVGFVTSYRKHRYVSHMDYLPERNKFRSSSFEREVVIGEHKERSRTFLNYSPRIMSWETTKDGKIDLKGSASIPDEIEYEDILSAFFNFRLGGYGTIERDKKFKINTIPSKGQSLIEVNITSREEAEKEKHLYGSGYNENNMYIKVRVPKEIFKSSSGATSLWINEKVIPIRGVVKDYIGFGDITGILRKK